MQELLKGLSAVVESQPFSQLLGLKVAKVEGSNVELSLPMRKELTQHYGTAHGGVLAFLADNSLTYSGGLSLMSAVVTSEFKINFVRPGIGDTLIARAKTIHAGKNQAVTQSEIFAVNEGVEKLIAIAQGTIVKVGPPPK